MNEAVQFLEEQFEGVYRSRTFVRVSQHIRPMFQVLADYECGKFCVWDNRQRHETGDEW